MEKLSANLISLILSQAFYRQKGILLLKVLVKHKSLENLKSLFLNIFTLKPRKVFLKNSEDVRVKLDKII